MMQPIYLGVDIAGAANTWFTALTTGSEGLRVIQQPKKGTLEGIFEYCCHQDVNAVAIDAQLTTSLSAENGFRPSDEQLRGLLPAEFKNWVASFNSLRAVPVRGMLLADHLSPIVGTILETHPRASLYFGMEKTDTFHTALKGYKQGPDAPQAVRALWRAWSERFHITADEIPFEDGALDALICATIASLYHRAPENLIRLSQGTAEARGRGPFYVLA